MVSPQAKRIKRIQKQLKAAPEAAALLVSAAESAHKTADQEYPFRQDSDFYYLTGSQVSGLALFFSSTYSRPILIAPEADPVKALWEGTPPSYKGIASSLGAELLVTSTPFQEVLRRLKGVHQFYYQSRAGSLGKRVADEVFSRPGHLRGGLPQKLTNSDAILTPMRLYKDADEIQLITHACAITADALLQVVPALQPGQKEYEIAATLEYCFKMAGGDLAFESIVAGGPSAATLHHHSSDRPIKKGEMLLLDIGASKDLYCSDITRVFPIGGEFSPLQTELYMIVLEAQLAALKAVRHKRVIKDIYNAAARIITEGLVDVGVLKGKVSTLFAKGAYKPYFPHGIGHTLGIDVHDVGDLRGNNAAILEEGMVFTVEPGIYIPKKIGSVPACGIRIEDTVHVTRTGCKVLTAFFPKQIPDIMDICVANEFID